MQYVAELLTWSPWQPLQGSWLGSRLPSRPGLYRIRRSGRDDLDYIGQTGLTLKQRLGMLRGVYADQMPYRDPHTAAPALWALRHRLHCDFEVSVVPVEGSTQWRKGLEALAISLYRQEHRQSPSFEFGRMPLGYRMSSQNNAKLAAAGKRFRGGPMPEVGASHARSLAPVGPLAGDPQSLDWCGHPWSPWTPVAEAAACLSADSAGLYRIRGRRSTEVLYIGQGKIASRLRAHLQKALNRAGAQGEIFAGAQQLKSSWVVGDAWLPNHLLELENDLIASHVLFTGAVPAAQFLVHA